MAVLGLLVAIRRDARFWNPVKPSIYFYSQEDHECQHQIHN